MLRDAAGRPIGILADALGPKIRLGTFDGPVRLKEGMEVGLECGRMEGHETEPVSPRRMGWIVSRPREGDPILLADGLIELKVVEAPSRRCDRTNPGRASGGRSPRGKGSMFPKPSSVSLRRAEGSRCHRTCTRT